MASGEQKKEEIILYGSPECAKYETRTFTETGWWTKDGRCLGENKEWAMEFNCTHRKCKTCGDIYPKHYLCQICENKRRIERFYQLPQIQWDKKTPLLLFGIKEESIAQYRCLEIMFYNEQEIKDFCRHRHKPVDNLMLIICSPVRVDKIDRYTLIDSSYDTIDSSKDKGIKKLIKKSTKQYRSTISTMY